MTYAEKLKNPEWQKLRLQVFERDEFSCRFCYSNVHTLNVHHIKYIKGHEPWEYPLDNFLTLCDSCHEAYHAIKKDIEEDGQELIKIIPTVVNLVALYDTKSPLMGISGKVYSMTGEKLTLFFENDLFKITEELRELNNK